MADSGSYSPETIARRQKIADALLMQAVKPREIRSPIQGLGQLGEAALAGYEGYRANEDEKSARKEAMASALQAFGGGDAAPTAMPMSAPASGDPAQVIAGIESGGKYDALGPETKGDRAYGKYQVMGANVPAWTKAHLGQEMTPEQFLQNPQAQDAVFKGQFGQYQNKYGPEGAAKAWFAGEGGMNNPNAKDILGTTVQSYADKFNKGMGNPVATALAAQPNAAPQPIPNANVAAALASPPVQLAQAGSGVPPTPQNAPASPAANPAGVPNNKAAIAALLNPWTPPALASALAGQINPTYGFQTLPDGTIIRTDPRHGTVQPIYKAETKSTFGKIGQNRDGQDIYGFINPEKGTATPTQIPGAAGSQGQPESGISGEEFLKSLNDTGRADLIKGMVEGRMAPAQMGRFGTQAVQSLLKDAARYEPGFDMTKWGARAATAKDFASGQAAKNVTSLNTVIGHLGDLSEKADALQNFSGIPLANKTANEIKNWMSENSGNPEVKNFNLARNAVADEMAKVFRGSGLSDAETRQWKENISTSGSPEELRGAISTAIGLMESRLNAMGEQRNKGMSTQTEPMALLTDKSRETLDRVKKWAAGEKPAQAGTQDAGVDPAALAEAKRRKLIK